MREFWLGNTRIVLERKPLAFGIIHYGQHKTPQVWICFSSLGGIYA